MSNAQIISGVIATAAAVTFAAAAAMTYVIESNVKGVLTFMVDTFGIEMGLDIASNGVEYSVNAFAAVITIAAIRAAVKA